MPPVGTGFLFLCHNRVRDVYPALPAEYSANTPPQSCPDRRRRRAAPELQTKPAVHCTDPAAPGALPRHSPKLNRSFLAVRFDSNTAANENSGSVARLKPWSARALLKRESERCSARPEKAKCQPGSFGRACLENQKQRRRSDVAWFYNGMASLENGMFKGRGR